MVGISPFASRNQFTTLQCASNYSITLWNMSRALLQSNPPARFRATLAAEAIAARGKFTVALSGGSLPNVLADGLTADPYLKVRPGFLSPLRFDGFSNKH